MESHNQNTSCYIPLITVLCLSYNNLSLYEAIDSIIEQNYNRMQLIVVDDASDSFNKDVLIAYINKKNINKFDCWTVICNEKNMGTVKALNLGVQYAKGEFIFTLAGDDKFADSRVLSDWVDAFQKSGALVMTAYRDVYDENMEHFLQRMPEENQVNKIKELTSQELFEELSFENFIFGCCTARSRKCLEQYGMFDEQYRLIEDYPMNLRLLRQGVSFCFFDRVVIHYRNNGVSSAAQINSVYEHDVDLIFENEILPYANNPHDLKKYFVKWKKQKRLEKKYYQYLKHIGNNAIKIFVLKTWYYAHHPLNSIKILLSEPTRFKRLFYRNH